MDAEIKVLRVLERAAKAIRRGESPELVAAALKWEQLFVDELVKLDARKLTATAKQGEAA